MDCAGGQEESSNIRRAAKHGHCAICKGLQEKAVLNASIILICKQAMPASSTAAVLRAPNMFTSLSQTLLQVLYVSLQRKLRRGITTFLERCGEFQEAFSHKELDAQQQSMVQQQAALQSQVISSILQHFPTAGSNCYWGCAVVCACSITCVAVLRGTDRPCAPSQLGEAEALLAATKTQAQEFHARLQELARDRESLKQAVTGAAPSCSPLSWFHIHTFLQLAARRAALETSAASEAATREERDVAAQRAHAAQAAELQALTDSIEELQAWCACAPGLKSNCTKCTAYVLHVINSLASAASGGTSCQLPFPKMC